MASVIRHCIVILAIAALTIAGAAAAGASPPRPADRSLGDSATVLGAAGHPLEMTLYGVYWTRTANKGLCPCTQPVAGAVAVRINATKAPDTLSTRGFFGNQHGRLYSEASAIDVPWAGCDDADRDVGTYRPGQPRLVIVDLEVPEQGGSLTYIDPRGKHTDWRLTGATAGTGFANARKYDVAYC